MIVVKIHAGPKCPEYTSFRLHEVIRSISACWSIAGYISCLNKKICQILSLFFHLQASARLKTDTICCYIDDSNLPEGCELKLVPVEEQERMVLPGSHSQYRLRPSEEYEPVC